ncbi:MAG: hypothetical protein ACREJC_19980 [Tepidisphaeraceae bacterium]
MSESPQTIQTGALSFWLSFASAWLAWTGVLTASALYIPTRADLWDSWPALLFALTLSLAAGAAGAICGLIFRSPLSRFYCLILGAMIGAWLGPVLFFVTVVLLTNSMAGWLNIRSESFLTIAWLTLIGLGTLSGYARSRRCVGLSEESRRAALLGLIIGPLLGILAGVGLIACFAVGFGTSFIPWMPASWIAVFVCLSTMCVLAVRKGEKLPTRGFEILVRTNDIP